MQLFFSPDLEEMLTLPNQEAIHALKVLRLGKHDIIHVMDGKGNLFETEILSDNPKHCNLSILSKKHIPKKRQFDIHIALAPTKSIDRTEWFVEKATEIGVDSISFLHCEHSERKQIKLERVSKICISACKQSQKTHLPQIHEMIKFKDFVEKDWESNEKYIAYIQKDKHPSKLSELISPKKSYLIVIGPEGGFSAREVALANDNNFQTISLGAERLRTETAAFCACHTIHILNDK